MCENTTEGRKADDSSTEIKTIPHSRSELAQLYGGVEIHRAVEVGHLPNGMANYLNKKARQFESLFQMLMGRRGDEINLYDTIDTIPPCRSRVELNSFVELDGDSGEYEFAVAMARRIESMFGEEHQYLTECASEDVDDEEVFIPEHQQFTSL